MKRNERIVWIAGVAVIAAGFFVGGFAAALGWRSVVDKHAAVLRSEHDDRMWDAAYKAGQESR